ncbi:hybrid sensor histidine kinase/response regulator [Helicobacter mustelae]|uniref:histidine kinase n=1 Tax=Helicobacter mustelae (strain ATCC 43772 / CCUG 25715 / CIP 103759 / LMG 18044 / NCTC 12198 / R85-136P) TaxID=679897 RepID=D3UGL8_HELM1|nr:chemotaxis protein CheW [Helicobacter mustelae]CBG39639.1 chemotaxis histidine kinase [Helicobacter mustelae 12198]SQH71150.1 chemotaxis histidine kinase [Helicobacter mustelae]
MEEMQEIMEDFLIEAFEMIDQLDQDLVELEHNPKDLDLLNKIFRVAHTIKGSGSFLNFDVLTSLTHNMEFVLDKARKNELEITSDIMDVILESVDLMKGLLKAIRVNKTDADSGIDIEECVTHLQAIQDGNYQKESTPAKKSTSKTKKAEPEENVDYSKMNAQEVEEEIARLLHERQESDKAKRAKKRNQEEAAKKAEQNTPANSGANNGKEARGNIIEQTIRVDVTRLDHLMNLIGELVLGKNRLLRIYGDVEERYDGEKFLEELNQVVSSVSTVTTDLQLAVMKTRMLPISKVFNKFPRMVRDLARDLDKKIELVISGEENELDKSIVEEIGDPLVHIIRNACDHGIESPDDRQEKGKDPTGIINLSAYNEGNHIVIKIQDDGKGLDPEMLKRKAVEKNLITQAEADGLSDKEAYSIILKPGFSTASSITNISGRGVGMDVVKTNIEQLNGMIEIESEKNVGTIMKLKIPLTLAIIQALLVGVQEEYYAIPLSSVLETVKVSQEEIYTINGKSVLRLRDEVLSLVRLADIFGVDCALENINEVYVVIIGIADQKVGIIVDYLIGQEEVVIKSLGYYLKGTAGIAGATVRGDGKITLIVDVPALITMAKEVKVNINQLMDDADATNIKQQPSDYVLLIVDDSATDRGIAKKFLSPLGITIKEATNGLEGLELLKNSEKKFDAVLLDIEMPKMDGYTLAGEIRKFNKFKNLPLIALTSRSSREDRMRGVESGITEYLTKPYTQEYLVNIVKRNINMNELGEKND